MVFYYKISTTPPTLSKIVSKNHLFFPKLSPLSNPKSHQTLPLIQALDQILASYTCLSPSKHTGSCRRKRYGMEPVY